jgi:hypothetical protein
MMVKNPHYRLQKNRSIGGGTMPEIKIGDVVTRKSYGGDIYFKVDDIIVVQGKECALLRSLVYRLCADAPLSDLEQKDRAAVDMHRQQDLKMQGQQLMRATKNGLMRANV